MVKSVSKIYEFCFIIFKTNVFRVKTIFETDLTILKIDTFYDFICYDYICYD